MKNINDKIILEDEIFPLEVPSEFPEECSPLIEEGEDGEGEEGDDSYNPSKGSNYSRKLYDRYDKYDRF